MSLPSCYSKRCRKVKSEIFIIFNELLRMNEMSKDLCNAILQGNIELVRKLIRNINSSDDNNWYIRVACQFGKLDIVSLLLDDPRIYNSQKTITESLPNQNDLSWALGLACHNGHIHVVKFILEKVPSVYIQKPLQWAKESKHAEIVDLLTEHMYRLDGPEYNKNII